MKKTLLSIVLLITLLLSMAIIPDAVAVNQKINYSDADWGTGKNPESSGLWKYEWRAGETGVISDMRWCTDGYFEAPFTSESASDTHWWCRVRNGGMGMHPGTKADSIKTFICPEDGKVSFRVTLNRQYAVSAGNNGSSVCVYLNDQKVWPTDKEVHELNDTSSITISIALDIKKNDLIRLVVGSLGASGGDGVVLSEHSVKYVSGDNLDPEIKTYTIACVGDSITEGYKTSGGLKGPTAYPAQLQKLFNEVDSANYEVKNFGRSTQTAIKSGDYQYVNTVEYTNSMASDPDIVIICFGANDSKPQSWNAAKFKADYKELIKGYQDLPSNPTVYLFYTTYVADPTKTSIRREVIQNEILPIEDEIARELGCKIIDLNTLTKNNTDKYADGVHPNDQLQAMMAQYIFDALCSENAVGLKSSDAKNTVTMIDPSKTVVTTPEQTTTKPVTTKPDTTKPDTTKPDTTKPDTTKPDTTVPDTTLPDTTDGSTTPEQTTTKPVTTKPDTTKPDTTVPDTTLPDTTDGSTTDTNTTDVPDATTDGSTTDANTTDVPDATTDGSTTESNTTSAPDTTTGGENNEPKSEKFPIFPIVACIVVLALVITFAVLWITKKKKKKV